MPIKLLHHKSWHVWKRENIERVKRDEAEAKKQEEENKKKRKRVETELRLKRIKRSSVAESEDIERRQHVNFFEEEQKRIGSGNPEYEREAKEKKQKELRKQGLAPLALGESASKAEYKAWYTVAPKSGRKIVKGAFGKNLTKDQALAKQDRDNAWKSQYEDPLVMMNKMVEQTKTFADEDSSQRDDYLMDDSHSKRHRKKHKRKSKKRKESRKRKDRRSS